MPTLPLTARIAAAIVVLAAAPAYANLPIEFSAPQRTIVQVDLGSASEGWSVFQYAYAPEVFAQKPVPFAPYTSGAELPDNRNGVALYAIRTARLAEFRERLAAHDPATPAEVVQFAAAHREDAVVAALLRSGADWVAHTPGHLGGRRRAQEGDPIHVIREHYRVTAIEDGQIVLERTSRKLFDKAGAEITPQEAQVQVAQTNVALVLLAALGLVGLVFVALRRMRSARTAAA